MNRAFRISSVLLLAMGVPVSSTVKAAPCTVPNAITNGQVADASKVMDNFTAVANCAQQGVTTTGTPATGSIPVFSGSGTIASSNLTGDVTTAGGTSTTLSNTGVAPGTYFNSTITIDSKGRVTNATSGGGGGGSISEWTNLTFGTAVATIWGGNNFFKADQAPDLSLYHKLEIIIGVRHTVGNKASIAVSADGQTSYYATQQDDGNWVLYRYTASGSSAILLSGGDIFYNNSGIVELGLTIWIDSNTTTNAVEASRFGPAAVKFVSDASSNVPLASNNARIYIQADGDDLSKIIYAKYRVW